MKKKYWITLFILITVCVLFVFKSILNNKKVTPKEVNEVVINNNGLTLPQGFKAIKLIEGIGKVRHIAVTPNEKIYARLAKPVNGNGTLMLEQIGEKAEVKMAFGNYGGTGVHLYNGYLYTASDTEIFRYKLDENHQVIDTTARETIVKGLLAGATHNTKSIMMDNSGNMYIPIGCPKNSCQENDREIGSMGIPDCPLLSKSGGVWQFKPDVLNQSYEEGIRFATGLRNVVAVDWNTQTNQLYVMQHGRDQLDYLFPELYTSEQNAELPAECMYVLEKGDDAGWPYIYYDGIQKKKIQMPEYGGDGIKEGSSKYIDPVAAYPAHMAPNDILFYTGNQFPERYRNGAFIAFHGSWNRRPEPQAGYFVVFQPFKNGKPFGDWEVFADGFSGSAEQTASGRAEHRPCGLAQGPDGSLYVSDDKRGAIYKIAYNKDFKNSVVISEKETITEESTKPKAVKDNVKVAYGEGAKVYRKFCAVCHMDDGGGVTNLNAPLIKTTYVLGDKNRLINVVLNGLSGVELDGETYNNAMPSHSFLSDKQIANVLTYVRKSFGNNASEISTQEVEEVRKKN